MGILTAEGREAVYSGEWTLKDLKLNYKIDKVKEISKIGRSGTTFSYQWKLIPVKIKEIANPEDLAALVDALYEQYKNGQNAQDFGGCPGYLFKYKNIKFSKNAQSRGPLPALLRSGSGGK